MNLHKEYARRKLIFVLFLASVLLVAAMCVVAHREHEQNMHYLPVAGEIGSGTTQGTDFVPGTVPPSAAENALPSPETTTAPTETTTVPTETTTAPTETTTAPTETTTTQPAATTTAQNTDRPRTECKGSLTVVTDSANVREDADKDARLVREIFKGETYEVIAQKNSPTGVLWYELKFSDGSTGYVSGSYVRYDGQVIGGKVYLTFDDGPSENTTRILDTLDKYGVKATFFVIYHKGVEDIYRDIVSRGHVIALHSYSHNYENIYSSEKAYFSDLEKLDKYIYDLTGVHSKVMRFPGGSSNTISKKYCKGIMSTLTKRVEEKGYEYYDWDVDSGDALDNTVDADKILRNIKNSMGNRREAIILMHDSKVKTTTADALPQIIEYLQDRGYAILPITEDTHRSHQRVNN